MTPTSTNRGPTSTPLVGVADPAIVKLGDPALAKPGETVTFTITVTNHGTAPALGVVVVDTLPSQFIFVSASAQQGTFSVNGNTIVFIVGTVNPGQVVKLIVIARLRPDVKPPVDVTNIATLTDNHGHRRTGQFVVHVTSGNLPATGEHPAEPSGLLWVGLIGLGMLVGAGFIIRRRRTA